MPYFLVTHRSLVEADTDRDAANKVLEAIRRSEDVTFEVKYDETTTANIVVSPVNASSIDAGNRDLSLEGESRAHQSGDANASQLDRRQKGTYLAGLAVALLFVVTITVLTASDLTFL